MSSTDPTTWYVAFAVGAACIFTVVVTVAALIQLARRIGTQLADLAETLALIHTSTAALPAIGGINVDAIEMNEVLALARQELKRLMTGGAP